MSMIVSPNLCEREKNWFSFSVWKIKIKLSNFSDDLSSVEKLCVNTIAAHTARLADRLTRFHSLTLPLPSSSDKLTRLIYDRFFWMALFWFLSYATSAIVNEHFIDSAASFLLLFTLVFVTFWFAVHPCDRVRQNECVCRQSTCDRPMIWCQRRHEKQMEPNDTQRKREKK